ncbi:hypothetical protein L1887_18020 [Cichorium endivia]|nr:hypothetical protein L1887_18020 [Cichorium endivia]
MAIIHLFIFFCSVSYLRFGSSDCNPIPSIFSDLVSSWIGTSKLSEGIHKSDVVQTVRWCKVGTKKKRWMGTKGEIDGDDDDRLIFLSTAFLSHRQASAPHLPFTLQLPGLHVNLSSPSSSSPALYPVDCLSDELSVPGAHRFPVLLPLILRLLLHRLLGRRAEKAFMGLC